MSAATFPGILTRLEKGERVVVGASFMDWVEPQRMDICTVHNPDRCGTVDIYVAFIRSRPSPEVAYAQGCAAADNGATLLDAYRMADTLGPDIGRHYLQGWRDACVVEQTVP